MISDFAKGFRYIFKGFGYLTHKDVRPFVVIPTAISIVLFSLAIWLLSAQFNSLVSAYIPDANALQDWPGWITWALDPIFSLVRILLYLVFGIAAGLLVFYSFTIVANIVGSPFNGLLAERVELMKIGKTPDASFNWKSFPKDTLKSVWQEVKKLVYNIGIVIPVFLLFVIPVLNLGAPVVFFLVSSWIFALQYTDFPSGNHQITFKPLRQMLRGRLWLTLGFGTAALCMTMIPILNFLAMPTSVIAATLLWLDEFEKPATSTN